MYAAIDFELIGPRPGFSDPCQVGVALFDSKLSPTGDSFVSYVRPENWQRWDEESAGVHGIPRFKLEQAATLDRVSDNLAAWLAGVGLPRRPIPIAHKWDVESATLFGFFGHAFTNELFHYAYRDTYSLALAINDAEKCFPSVGLSRLCEFYGIEQGRSHDALADAVATGKLYWHLMTHSSHRRPTVT